MRVIAIALSLLWATAAAAAEQCTFWIGIAQQEARFPNPDPGHDYEDTQRTAFRARLREESHPRGAAARVALTDAGSMAEGSLQAKLSGKGGNESSGNGKTSGPKSRSEGTVVFDKTGRAIQYELDLRADGTYPVQTKWYDGNVTTSNQAFQDIRIGSGDDPQKPRALNGNVMQGNYAAHEGERHFVNASWNLKPVVAPCDRPPGIPDIGPAPTEKCPPPTTQRALMDTFWAQREAKAKQLEEDFKELQDAYQRMQDNLEAWRSAIPICAIEEIGEKLAEAFIAKYGGEQAELTETLGKIATGDLSYMTPSSFNDAASNIGALLAAAAGVGNPTRMEEQISDCKALPEDLKSAAKAFVDAYAEVKAQMPKIQREVNDTHSKDQQYWDEWHKYYQACLEYAECMGTAPDCPEPPEQPSGPMPGQQ